MDKYQKSAEDSLVFPVKEAEAIKQCLAYLEAEANKIGLVLTAHMIGVATETITQTMSHSRAVQVASRVNGERLSVGGTLRTGRSAGYRPIRIKLNGSKS